MNRIQAAIDKRAEQLKQADQAAIEKVTANCDNTEPFELAMFQTKKSLAQASGLITLEESQTLYEIFGGETASVEQFKRHSLAEKMTALEVIFEIMQKMS